MKKLKIILAIPLAICLLVTLTACHPDPIFNIGNKFDQSVTVYFNGHDVGKISPGESKIFYPNEVLTTNDSELRVELRGDSGKDLFSKSYTWDELTKVLESVQGKPYWIGN